LRTLLLLGLVAAGCQNAAPPGKSQVVVSVTGKALCVDHLTLTVKRDSDGKSVMPMVIPPSKNFSIPPIQTLALEFDAGVTGLVHITVAAIDGKNNVLASDMQDATLPTTTMVTITLNEPSGFHKLDSGLSTDEDLRGVYMTGDEVFAVGQNMNDPHPARVVHSKDRGCTWERLMVGGDSGFWAIGGGDGHIYIVGDYMTIFHSENGGVDWPPDTGPDNDFSSLYSVTVAKGGDAYAVGTSSAVFYRTDHTGKWATEANPTSETANAVFAIGSSPVVSVGEAASIAIGPGTWKVVGPMRSPNYEGVWGSSATDIWIVGDDGGVYHETGDGLYPMYGNAGVILLSVWGFQPGRVYFGGDAGAIFHTEGNTLKRDQNTNTNQPIYGAYGDGTDLYLVGGSGTILRGP
jgi:hypothetical protein